MHTRTHSPALHSKLRHSKPVDVSNSFAILLRYKGFWLARCAHVLSLGLVVAHARGGPLWYTLGACVLAMLDWLVFQEAVCNSVRFYE